MPRVSKSTNVCGYVKAERRRRALQRQLALAAADALRRYAKLTGAQIGEAARILASDGRGAVELAS